MPGGEFDWGGRLNRGPESVTALEKFGLYAGTSEYPKLLVRKHSDKVSVQTISREKVRPLCPQRLDAELLREQDGDIV